MCTYWTYFLLANHPDMTLCVSPDVKIQELTNLLLTNVITVFSHKYKWKKKTCNGVGGWGGGAQITNEEEKKTRMNNHTNLSHSFFSIHKLWTSFTSQSIMIYRSTRSDCIWTHRNTSWVCSANISNTVQTQCRCWTHWSHQQPS